MWTIPFLLAFAFIGSINTNPVVTPKEYNYAYHAETSLYNNVSKTFVSRFDIFAILVYQTYEDHAVIKLNKVKISAFNGNEDGHEEFPKVDVPIHGNVIMEPFVYYHDQHMAFKENDPFWSMNMKRAITSTLHVDVKTITNKENHVQENNMYGMCDVSYNYVPEASDQVLHVEKTIDMSKCRDNTIFFWPENHMTTCRDFDFMKRKVKRSYYFGDKENLDQIDRIQSNYSLVLQDAPGAYHHIEMIQLQNFDLTYSGDIKEPIDISEVTKKKDIKFEAVGEAMEIFELKKQLPEKEMTTYTLDALKVLKNELIKDDGDNMHQIYAAVDGFWRRFKEQKVDSLEATVKQIGDDEVMKDLFLSALPYEGNENTVKFIQKLLTSHDIDVTKKLNLLITYPKKLTGYYAKDSEFLLDMKDEDRIVKNVAVLTHSQLVNTAHKDYEMTDEKFKETVEKYIKVFKTSEDYETRMIYLLGLHNMNTTLDVWMPIILDSHESRHLRFIAIKNSLKYVQERPLKVKHDFMSLLKNESLHFELRVAALDTLLESHMPIEEYDEIYEYLKEESGSLNHQHLYNYFYTTLQSNTFEMECYGQLYYLSARYFKKLKFPTSSESWITSNIKSSFINEGSDYGTSYEVKMAGAPNTKGVETFQITIKKFAMNMDRKYSMHVTSHGVFEDMMTDLNKIPITKENYIHELLKILKDNEARLMESTDFHLDVILFINDRASFAIHLNPDTFLENFQKAILSIPKMLFRGSATIDYPASNYIYIPSDLGTDVEMVFEEETLKYYNNDVIRYEETSAPGNYTFRYRGYWTNFRSLKTLNPISNLKHGAVSELMSQYNQKIPLAFKKVPEYNLYLEIFNNDLMFSGQREIVRKTLVNDEEKLHHYCKECSRVVYYEDKTKEVTRNSRKYPMVLIRTEYELMGTRPSEDDQIGIFNLEQLHALSLTTLGNFMSLPLSYFYYILKSKMYRNTYNPSWYTLKESFKSSVYEKDESITVLTFGSRRSTTKATSEEKLPGEYAEVSLGVNKRYVGLSRVEMGFNVTQFVSLESDETNTTFGILMDLVGLETLKENSTMKGCLLLNTIGPGEPVDMYSLEPAKPAKFDIVLKLGNTEEEHDKCPLETEWGTEMTGKFSVLDKQKDHPSIKKCMKDSEGKKFNVPTENCQKAAHEINTYRGFDLEGHLIGGATIFGGRSNNFTVNIEILESKIHFQAELDNQPEKLEFTMYPPLNRRNYGEYLLANSQENINPHMTSSSSCDITSNFVNTFNGSWIKNYDKSSEMVAWIECEKGTNGLTYKVRDDGHLEMTSWINDRKVVVKPEGTGLKVFLDDNEFGKGSKISDNIFQMYYLADDVLYIHGKYLHVYYNPEYIVSEIMAHYNGQICGICSPMENIMKIKH